MVFTANTPSPTTGFTARHAARQLRRIARELAGTRRYTPRRRRVLYKQASALSDVDIDVIVAEIGASRVMEALDRYTQPRFAFAAE